MSFDTIPPSWDEDFYLESNPDVKKAVTDGAFQSGYEHFVRIGSTESRQFRFVESLRPPLDWSLSNYLEAHPEVKDEFTAIDESTLGVQAYGYWERLGRFKGHTFTSERFAERFGGGVLPKVVIEEMFYQSLFETKLFPMDYLSDAVEKYDLDWMIAKGRALKLFVREITKRYESIFGCLQTPKNKGKKLVAVKASEGVPRRDESFTHVILAPWLKTGGADKAALLFANSVARQPNTKVLFITTEPTSSPWVDRLDRQIVYFDLGNSFAAPGLVEVSLSFLELRDMLLAYLLDNSPQCIHVINSHLGWFLLGKYGRVLSNRSRLYVSLYCYDYTEELEPVGYARFIRHVAPFLTGIFSDNSVFPKQLSDSFGLAGDIFHTTWHPADVPGESMRFVFAPAATNVLWASRLDRQKGVDVLIDVARRCPDLIFHVYGEFVMHDANSEALMETIRAQRNIIFHGPYSRLSEIRRIPYRGFLYTSKWDGLPNILLEIGALGLPIISPLVGGISDLVTVETGYPVTNGESAVEYVAALREIAAQPAMSIAKVENLAHLVGQRHSTEHFLSTLDAIGYFNTEPKG